MNTVGRRDFSTVRLAELRSAFGASSTIKEAGLCIYATGSFGRLEAHPKSDLDLFLLTSQNVTKSKSTRSDELVLLAEIIGVCRKLEFPEFDQGGNFLHVHHLDQMTRYLGSAEDDSSNHFTARMLLLLESNCLSGDDVFNACKTQLLDQYFRDHHNNESTFFPVFLINDILRYWRTLCLNFEYSRILREEQKRTGEKVISEEQIASKAKLKNFKLKFSRIITCFSMVAPLVCSKSKTDQAFVLRLSNMLPMERLREAVAVNADGKKELTIIETEYDWFLSISATSEPELESWVAKKDNWQAVTAHAAKFRTALVKLMQYCKRDELALSYLIV